MEFLVDCLEEINFIFTTPNDKRSLSENIIKYAKGTFNNISYRKILRIQSSKLVEFSTSFHNDT